MVERVTRSKAIRLKCLDCCCGNSAEVRRCDLKKCPLHPYRMGNEKKAAHWRPLNRNPRFPRVHHRPGSKKPKLRSMLCC